MLAAVITPKVIDIKAFFVSSLRIVAITEAVQTPVVGIGIATKKNKPIKLYFFIVWDLFIDLLLIQPIVPLKNRVFSK